MRCTPMRWAWTGCSAAWIRTCSSTCRRRPRIGDTAVIFWCMWYGLVVWYGSMQVAALVSGIDIDECIS